MRGINKVIVVGTLGRDPEINYTSGGTAVANLAIATEKKWTDKNTGEEQKKTAWHRVKMFGRLAEVAGEYLKKGRQVYIEGELDYGKYTDKDGIERYTTDILAFDLQMLGGSGDGGQRQGNNAGGQRGNQARDRQTQLDQRGSHGVGNNNHRSAGSQSENFQQFDDDDIPF